ncbi:hypothetical protein F4821DRAFT_143351 [Hypoxylon rubiginosum]|uniref:Uncharacterized protein n=1 Tax=Hypoxylon rubiginosum TaxID=110542 RepID=A0ACC0CZH2_9PEZI|nr:hypothetical protein F4821DRAFT_143351 [Hypoxylon rubiginosum]
MLQLFTARFGGRLLNLLKIEVSKASTPFAVPCCRTNEQTHELTPFSSSTSFNSVSIYPISSQTNTIVLPRSRPRHAYRINPITYRPCCRLQATRAILYRQTEKRILKRTSRLYLLYNIDNQLPQVWKEANISSSIADRLSFFSYSWNKPTHDIRFPHWPFAQLITAVVSSLSLGLFKATPVRTHLINTVGLGFSFPCHL